MVIDVMKHLQKLLLIAALAVACAGHAQTVTPVSHARTNSQVWGGYMYVRFESLDHTVPFTTCTLTVTKYANGVPVRSPVTKTVWLKNLPARTVSALDNMAALEAERVRLIETRKRLDVDRFSPSVNADYYTTENDNWTAENARFDYDLAAAQAELKKVENDRAMPTGQIYIGKEVWDCGLRPGETPRL